MKLSKLKIRNFRCYQEEISISFDDITAIIGKNDIGKSTILDALNIFLNDESPDKDDASKNGNNKDLTIICEFTDLPEEVIIDSDYYSSLSSEYMLNNRGILEIHKTFNGSLSSPKIENISIFALHPKVENYNDLLQLKNSDLKKRAKELNIDLKDIDSKINSQIRKKIWNNNNDLQLSEQLIQLNKKDSNNIWESLKVYIPAFAIFKSDRASTDKDPEAQDPLNSAIREAIKLKETELKAISEYVELEVKKIADLTLKKLNEMDPNIANTLKPQISIKKWDSLFTASITGDENIPINKRGSGVKRLILLNFFRAKAEKELTSSNKQNIIYGIEEPETSQHPNNQRLLLRALTELSSESQVIITTHTPMLARALPDSNLRYIHLNVENKREIKIGGDNTNKLLAKTLGVLPDNNVKLFIGVEGKHDISFFQKISKILLNDGVDVPDLEQLEINGEIIFFPLGGSNVALWTSRLSNLNRPEFHLFDRDNIPPQNPKYMQAIDEINNRENCKALCTGKRELENYLHKDAIILSYNQNGININIEENFEDFDDVPLEIAKIVHKSSNSPIDWDNLEKEKKDVKMSNVKRVLNNTAVNFMTKKLLEEIDPNGDVLGWFKEINILLDSK